MKKTLALSLFLSLMSSICIAQDKSTHPVEYSSGTISVGIVVSNMKKSLKFYKEVLGLKETGGFTVEREVARKTGLTSGKPFDVKVLKTVDDPNATEWKLMTFKNKSQHPEQKHIQDDTGMQYVTMYVKSLDPFIPRLKKARVKRLGKTPTQIPDGRYFILIQDPDGTFIELIGPMTTDK
ncbi:VOC family protein [Roseivirga sp. E12]|uniref:VOC family protein n=1 Tax=Roseivirga sp. E12 TaxID=2819237 RepID=UPI001ABC2735|nr:VOC family protein [Roseivirga sp. E12]MBO3697774.1 VOC family protein [Roseivirga sp. E12]